MNPEPGTQAWLDLVSEPILDPQQNIVDPHHHLWHRPSWTYVLPELWADTGSGHHVSKTVFVECGAGYLESGPEHLKPVGETRFVADIAKQSRQNAAQATIAGIVARADLRLPLQMLDEVLDAHESAGDGLFRGIRHAGARALYPEGMRIPGNAPEGLYADTDFRRGVRRLGERGLSYDTWHYHYQNKDFIDLARSAPETTLVLDHFGTPLGVGPFAGKRDAIFTEWCHDMETLAACPNVVAKLGGLAMPDNGFGWDRRSTPATSDEIVEAQARYYHHMIDCFGAQRCMFESNFPVDRWSISYAVLWNAFKKLAADFPAPEKDALFFGTATRIYNL